MLIAVYYVDGAPNGLLVATHELAEHSLPQQTFDEDWGSITYEKGGDILAVSEKLLLDDRGLVLLRETTHGKTAGMCDGPRLPHSPSTKLTQSAEESGCGDAEPYVVVSAQSMQFVKRVDADGETIWCRDGEEERSEEPKLEKSIEEKLDQLLSGI